MPQGPVIIRRGRRTDFPLLLQLLQPVTSLEHEKTQLRHWRRVASDPSHDFYVAQQDDTIRGMVLVSYIRRLTDRGWWAILDLAVPDSMLSDVRLLLIDFAKTRARQRGCHQLLVWTSMQDLPEELTRLFFEAGFLRSGEVLSCALQ